MSVLKLSPKARDRLLRGREVLRPPPAAQKKKRLVGSLPGIPPTGIGERKDSGQQLVPEGGSGQGLDKAGWGTCSACTGDEDVGQRHVTVAAPDGVLLGIIEPVPPGDTYAAAYTSAPPADPPPQRPGSRPAENAGRAPPCGGALPVVSISRSWS